MEGRDTLISPPVAIVLPTATPVVAFVVVVFTDPVAVIPLNSILFSLLSVAAILTDC